MQLVNAWPYGDLYVLEQLWRRLGIGEVIAQICGGRKFDFDIERALFALVANRACAASAKLYGYEQWLKEEVHLEGAAGLELQHLCRAMDFLEANKEAIEKAIYFRMADLLNLDAPPAAMADTCALPAATCRASIRPQSWPPSASTASSSCAATTTP